MSLGLHKIQGETQIGLTIRELAVSKGRRGPKPRSLADRLAARTAKGPGCWLIAGYQQPGHGYVYIGNGHNDPPYLSAHRAAYLLAYGPIPDGLEVMHSCDVPNCVNPAHLSLGTHAQNLHDSLHKGRFNAFGIQKLNAAQVREIRERALAGETQKAIGARFGIARNTVSGIVNRRKWAHVDAPFSQ